MTFKLMSADDGDLDFYFCIATFIVSCFQKGYHTFSKNEFTAMKTMF